MEASGELTSDAVWEGDVLLQGDVVVPEGRTLRLRAGTVLSFAAKPRWSCAVFRSAPEGYPIETSSRERCDLVVFGRLEVEGSAERPVEMGRPDCRWGGIALLGNGTARLEHARVRGASGGEDALIQCFDDSRLELRNCVLSGARVGVLAWGLSSVAAHESEVEDLGCAFFCREGSTTDLFRVRGRRLEQGVWGQNFALARLEGCRFESCSDFGAGAYDRSRLTVVSGFFGACRQGLLGASNASVEALGAVFRGNRVGVQGIESGRLSLKDCVIASSEEHGAKFSQTSRATVADCRFEHNRLAGLFTEDSARAAVSGCEFEEPSAATAERS
ncbi:MAG: right-handed parallel beta-helix repeat-containing protein [Elusimicrobiota bacterium]